MARKTKIGLMKHNWNNKWQMYVFYSYLWIVEHVWFILFAILYLVWVAIAIPLATIGWLIGFGTVTFNSVFGRLIMILDRI